MNHQLQKIVKATVAFSAMLFLSSSLAYGQADPLPSWNDTKSKQAIMAFVENVTAPDSNDYLPPAERIATFDNDGTLWGEQPLYFQLFFIFDRLQALAPQHPEWKTQEPFASVLKGDQKGALAGGKKALMELAMAAHGNNTNAEFKQIAADWLATAKHPESGRAYTEMVYQPMLELLHYLRDNQFKTYIVSGGGLEFIRGFAEEVYGIPPEQVIGSNMELEYQIRDGKPVIARLPELYFYDDKGNKPLAIQRQIGRRPVMAFGNSDGDFQMLEWTTTGTGPRFGLLVHHTDGEREVAYDRDSHIGRLVRGLDEGPKRGWTIVSIKDDWKTLYPFQK